MSFLSFVVDVAAWLWASAALIAVLWFGAIILVYVLFRLVLAYNAYHYDVVRQLRPKFNEHYAMYLKDLTERQVRKGYQADEDIEAVSEFLSEREITRKWMN